MRDQVRLTTQPLERPASTGDLRAMIEMIGPEHLLFATDYPHSESWFPKSVDAFLGWTSIPETVRRKLLWDNAARCYRRYGGRPSRGQALMS